MEAIKTDKEPIMPLLKGMNLGESKCYPLERYSTVKAIVSTVKISTGKNFTTKKQGDNICVTRIK